MLESTIYALTMGSLIVLVMTKVFGISPRLVAAVEQQGILSRFVMSLGAGVYEELVFRLGPAGRHSSALAERVFRWGTLAFAARSPSLSRRWPSPPSTTSRPTATRSASTSSPSGCWPGSSSALLFWFRGLAVAVYTHALYDVYVLLIR